MEEYPHDAYERRLSGRALVECEIIADGLLDHCRVLEEQPTGYGFGDAAIRLAFEHHALPSADGRIPVGKRVGFPVDFPAPP